MDSDPQLWDELRKLQEADKAKASEGDAILMIASGFYYQSLENASYAGYQMGYKNGEIAGARGAFHAAFQRGRQSGVDIGVSQSARLWLAKRLAMEKTIFWLWRALAVAVIGLGLLALGWMCAR